MAGKPGRSGGKRAGSGAKKKPAATTVTPLAASTLTRDPIEFLLDVMQGRVDANAGQIRAATAALPFVHKKPGAGKKDERADAAKRAATGIYAPTAPPKLAAVRPIK